MVLLDRAGTGPLERRYSGAGPALERSAEASSASAEPFRIPEEDAMSATIRRTARSLAALVAVPCLLLGTDAVAQASPDPGPEVGQSAATTPSYGNPQPWLVFPGWRGYLLPPAERGNVLEFLDH
jgi:hypothetical protein